MFRRTLNEPCWQGYPWVTSGRSRTPCIGYRGSVPPPSDNSDRSGPQGLALTGERTVPGIAEENYWFRRHEVAYQWLVEFLSPRLSASGGPETRVIVDAGCGEGYGCALLSQGLDAQVIGLELDDAALAHAQARYATNTCQFHPANLDSWPLPSDSAHCMVSLQVLEHLWNVPAFLAETLRVVTPGGTIAVATPNRLTFSPGLGRGESPTNPFHVEEFDAEQLGNLFEQAGFADVTVWGLHHSQRLASFRSSRGDIVASQVHHALAGTPFDPELTEWVSSVTVDDFIIDSGETHSLSDSLDLIVTAVCPLTHTVQS